MTGGNDGCIAVWDISECVKRPGRASRISNGKNDSDLLYTYSSPI